MIPARRILDNVVCALMALATLIEVSIGVLQLCGFMRSNHSAFPVTGTFLNPGPYGGWLAVFMAGLMAYVFFEDQRLGKFVRVLAVIALLCGLVILPSTRSRTAWVALIVPSLILFRKVLGRYMWLICAALCVFGVLAFGMKKDSAMGRLHIWHMECRALMISPLKGTGKGTAMGAYGVAQASYFQEKERSSWEKKVAGCPEYAFNEYLRIGIESGVPVMVSVILLLIVLVVYLYRLHSPMAFSLLALCIFSFGSYPFEAFRCHYGRYSVEVRKAHSLINRGYYAEAVDVLRPLYDVKNSDYKYLFDFGYALHKMEEYTESNEVLRLGAKYSSDPMFHIIIGKNFQYLGMYDLAEKEFLFSHYMVPCRIFPLYLLMCLKIDTGLNSEAVAIATDIQGMPVNKNVSSMVEIYNKSMNKLDSLLTAPGYE